jgi:hypothetical protein
MTNFKLLRVVWPAFLAACMLELAVFAMVDPQDLTWASRPLPLSRQAVYTVSFFVFWAISSVSNAITLLLCKSAAEVNVCPFPATKRPDGCPQR